MKGADEMNRPCETVKQSIIAKVFNDNHVSFIELERIFDDHQFSYKGNRAIYHSIYSNIQFWGGWNEQAVDLLASVLEENQICLQPASYVNYLIDGEVIKLPIATEAKDYQTDHWMPMLLTKEV